MSESNDRPRDWLDTELDETLEEMFELEFSEPMMDDDIRRLIKKETRTPWIIGPIFATFCAYKPS